MADVPVPLLTAGLAAASTALVAWWGDRRRARRKNIDAVGFMPWTLVFFLATFLACVLLGLAARMWLGGGS